MEDVYKLKTRGSAQTFLRKLYSTEGEETCSYLLKTDSLIMRTGEVEVGKKFIDPSGGPMIVEGEVLREVGKRVKYLDFSAGNGWVVTFEKD